MPAREGRKARYRRVSIFVDAANQAIGWGVEFLHEADTVGSLFCSCVSPWSVAALLERLDTLTPKVRPSQIAWTSWAGGSRPIQPAGRIKVWLPGWTNSYAKFSDDGSVQFPLGVTYDDLL